MTFALTEEQEMLRDTVARFVREQYDIATRHKIAASDAGVDREMWGRFAELGLIGALLPEEVGGFGGRGADLMLVMTELGRGLVVEPFLATAVLGAGLIAELGSDDQKAQLESVTAGETLLAFAHGEPDGRYAPSHVQTRAAAHAEGWRLDGRKAVVLNGDSADRLIVSARTDGMAEAEDGLGLFLVEAGAAGLEARGYQTADGGRAAELRLEGVPAAALGEPGDAFPAIERAVARGVLALCAEAVGVMEAARDLTLDFLKTRQQFGRPLGAFQALQHRMVDLCVEIEQARSATLLAASRIDADRLARESAVSSAKNLIGRAGRLVAEESIQMHGGMGMTWETALPHFAKRLIMIDHLFGDADHHLERFIALSRAG